VDFVQVDSAVLEFFEKIKKEFDESIGHDRRGSLVVGKPGKESDTLDRPIRTA
jgi:hypothetical protein